MQNNVRCLIRCLTLCLTLCLALAAGLTARPARADGAYFPRRDPVAPAGSPVSEPAQKAAILYGGGVERLIISPSYRGPAGGFAWVVPVPARPQVRVLTGALFHELARIVAPPPPPMAAGPPRVGSARPTPGARPPVVLLERETLGAYDVSVLSATDPGALRAWLGRNGYALPPAAVRPLAGYVREGWTFVACRVQAPHDARGLRSGTLAPLSLTFPAARVVYPMRLSSVNPRPFALLLYLLRRSGEAKPRLSEWPGPRPPSFQPVHVTLPPGEYPTVAGLGLPALDILWTRQTFAPRDCTQDYVWAVPPARSAGR